MFVSVQSPLPPLLRSQKYVSRNCFLGAPQGAPPDSIDIKTLYTYRENHRLRLSVLGGAPKRIGAFVPIRATRLFGQINNAIRLGHVLHRRVCSHLLWLRADVLHLSTIIVTISFNFKK